MLKHVAEIDLGSWARQARGAQAQRPWPSCPTPATTQSNLCPKGLDRNDHGAAFHPKGIALWGYPISDVPCGEAFSGQTTYFITFKTASEINDQIIDDEKASTSFTMTGTHQGTFFGIPATGKPVKIHGMVISRLEEGKIIEEWEILDQLALFQQLGVVSLPE